jgi:hypothetical protein
VPPDHGRRGRGPRPGPGRAGLGFPDGWAPMPDHRLHVPGAARGMSDLA